MRLFTKKSVSLKSVAIIAVALTMSLQSCATLKHAKGNRGLDPRKPEAKTVFIYHNQTIIQYEKIRK